VQPLPVPLWLRFAIVAAALHVQTLLMFRFVERGPDY
jgi:hypothetical protein